MAHTTANQAAALLSLSVVLACVATTNLAGQTTTQLSDKQKEEFLLTAKLESKKQLSVGITGSERATFSDGSLRHDAHLQDVDEFKARYQGLFGTELNFRDSYKFNIAAYRLDRLINLNMVPVSVERTVAGRSSSVTWWLDDIQMMELDRYKKKITPPDQAAWNDQMYNVRVFNELVYNTDANLGNVLISNDWDIRLIDYSRAFRTRKNLREPKNLVKIDRRVYDGLRNLNAEMLQRKLGDVLRKAEISAILARRDLILKFFEGEIARRGEKALICDLPKH